MSATVITSLSLPHTMKDYYLAQGYNFKEEELDICGETGREFDRDNSVKGCGKKITEDDENIMIGNISYCCECGENGLEEEVEACEDCGVELRIGSENNPSDHSIFNGVCDDCREEEVEELDANGNSNSDYKKAEKECPIGYIVVWNRWEKGFKYRKLDKDGYMEALEFE